MRLVCPNCDAQYEVAQNAIPPAGRDVQCSNCGHAWFQAPAGADAPPADDDGLAALEAALAAPAETAPASELTAGPDAAPVPEAPAAPDVTTDTLPDDPAPPPPAEAAPPRGLDENLLAVLREEAERETQARRAEDLRGVEVQTELSLPPAASALSATQRRLAMLKGEDPDAPPPAPPRPAARRDLLPDVEQINSTLRSSSATRDDEAETDALPDLTRPNSAFRSGFLLMLVLAVLVLVVYMAAPRLAEQFPAAADALNGFVARVDALRGGLDRLMESATAALNGLGG